MELTCVDLGTFKLFVTVRNIMFSCGNFGDIFNVKIQTENDYKHIKLYIR